MIVRGKIEAIKALRTASSQVQIFKNQETERTEIIPGLGLKEAKDLVEAIMDMAVQEFLQRETERIARLRATTDSVTRDLNTMFRYDPMQR
jgi:hypothetical protein